MADVLLDAHQPGRRGDVGQAVDLREGARTAASRTGWVSITTGTDSASEPRPFWITDSMPIPCSPSAPAMWESTPGRSSAVKRR